MARGRLLCRTLSTSQRRARLHEEIPGLAEFAQALFDLLVAHSDDFGRLQGDAFTVKHAIEPTTPRSLDDFGTVLQALNAVGMIQWYDVQGRKFIQIKDFDDYQTGLHKRTKSKFPEAPASSRKLPLKRTEGKRTELKGREQSSARPSAAPPLLTTWSGKWERRWGELFVPSFQKHGAQLKRLEKNLGRDEVIRRMDVCLALDEEWWVKRRHPLDTFISQINQFVGRTTKMPSDRQAYDEVIQR